ncbi:MAG: hypothetical protein ABII90_05700, partial [Bacteroidota bacterium]
GWTSLAVTGSKSGVENLTRNGNIYWTDPGSGWGKQILTSGDLGSTSGVRKLYWVKGVPAGSYSTAPVIVEARTDILLVQYYGTITGSTWEEGGEPTMVKDITFRGTGLGTRIKLYWQTNDETDIFGFRILRSESNSEPIRVEDKVIMAQGSPGGYSYTYTDDQVTFGTVYDYWLEVIFTNGETGQIGPIEVDSSIEYPFSLQPVATPTFLKHAGEFDPPELFGDHDMTREQGCSMHANKTNGFVTLLFLFSLLFALYHKK